MPALREPSIAIFVGLALSLMAMLSVRPSAANWNSSPELGATSAGCFVAIFPRNVQASPTNQIRIRRPHRSLLPALSAPVVELRAYVHRNSTMGYRRSSQLASIPSQRAKRLRFAATRR